MTDCAVFDEGILGFNFDQGKRRRLASFADQVRSNTEALRKAYTLVETQWDDLSREQLEYLRAWPDEYAKRMEFTRKPLGVIGYLRGIANILNYPQTFQVISANTFAAIRLDALIRERIEKDLERGKHARRLVASPERIERVRKSKVAFKDGRHDFRTIEELSPRTS